MDRWKSVSCILLLLLMPSLIFSADYRYIVTKYNDSAGSIPFVGSELSGEVVKVIVTRPGGVDQFGFRTSPDGSVKEYSEQPYADSTVELYVSDRAAQELQNSPQPLNTFRSLWGTEIRHRGLNFFSSVKLFFYDIGYEVFNFLSPILPSRQPPADFSGLFNGSATVSCADTSPTAGGDVILLQADGQESPRPIRQGKNSTCVPNGLIWILEHLNITHPGLAMGNRTAEFRNISSGLVINENGTITGSIPGGIARYINSTGKNSTIRIYGNWSLSNGTWILGVGNETPMATKNASVLVGGQNVSIVNSTNYTQIMTREFNEGEGILILFDQHAVAGVAVINADGTIDIMDPAQGAFVNGVIQNGELIVYTPGGEPYRQGVIIAIIAISPDMLR